MRRLLAREWDRGGVSKHVSTYVVIAAAVVMAEGPVVLGARGGTGEGEEAQEEGLAGDHLGG